MANTTGKMHRDYCIFLNGTKYNRNIGCKAHDNAYGVRGGGTEKDRLRADRALYGYMKENHDPMAFTAYFFTRAYGWAFFNYHRRPWKGQLIWKIFPHPHQAR